MAAPRLRSMAFGPDGTRFLLVSSKSGVFVFRATRQEDRFEMVRRVANTAWWFDVVANEKGGLEGVFRDASGGVGKRKVYDLSSESRAKSTKRPVACSHHFTTSLQSDSLYALAGLEICRYDEGQWLSLDGDVEATESERAARFFVSTDKGIHRRSLLDGPDGWQLIGRAKRFGKQLAFDPSHKVVACAARRPAALFVDSENNASCYERDGGLWSVCAFDGRFFFYSFGQGVVELSKKGEEVIHGVNGEISRNQCLFANADALYFVCHDQLHCYQGGRWRTIDAVAQAASFIEAQVPKAPTRKLKGADKQSLAEQLARVHANPADDAERLVYADMLTEAGSLQGEFIMLQLLKKKSQTQKRRISELTRAYGHEWIGPLNDKLVKRGRAFSRGFLSKAECKSMSESALQEVLQIPELATISSLDLAGAQLSDLGSLARLTELEKLEVGTSDSADLVPLKHLTKLRELTLHGPGVKDLAPLSGLAKLETLQIRATPVNDLAPLAGLVNLRELDVSLTSVSSLRPLSKLTKLKRLKLNQTPVATISPIAKLTALEVLNFASTQVSEVGALRKLTELEYLTISADVDDPSAFAELKKLRQLCHDRVPKTKLSAIKKLLPEVRVV